MSAADPLGYYLVLGVASNATTAEIKAGFRRKAMEYHPDRCKLPNATILFQQVNSAFSVLGDPESRARYDTSGVETSDTARPSATRRAAPEPIRCSVCSKVSAQPRYVIFYRVYSFIVMTRREAVQGIYCSKCAEKECLKATAFTWALAWWGFPWGPIYGLQAIFTNLKGGQRPGDINARILAHQAWYFSATGQTDVARAVAEQALWRSVEEQVQQAERWVVASRTRYREQTAVRSIPGVGVILGLTIALETGDIARFASASDYASYCRLVKSERISNGKVKGHGNRKCGNRYLAWAWIEAANYALINPAIRRWYDRKCSHRHKVLAIKAVAHKLARVGFFLMRDGGAFDVQRAFG